MANALPALARGVTSTTGTNNYTISDPASIGNYRTDAQAVTDGSLSDGDTVVYVVRDTSITGDVAFEWGIGTYTAATRTVSRTAGNVLDSSTGVGGHTGTGGPGNLVTWAASGQRDIYLTAAMLDLRNNLSEVDDASAARTNLAVPGLGTANVLTGNNTYRADTFFDRTDTTRALVVIGNQKNVAGLIGRIRFDAQDSAANSETYAQISSNIVTATSGSEDGEVTIDQALSGSFATSHTFGADGSIQDRSGEEFDHFPAGTEIIFTATIPAGWTRVNDGSSRLMKLAESGDTLGGTGGNNDYFSTFTTQAHTLTIAQMPAHNHEYTSGAGGTTHPATTTGAPTGGTGGFTKAEGGGGGHTHQVLPPLYRIVARATKD